MKSGTAHMPTTRRSVARAARRGWLVLAAGGLALMATGTVPHAPQATLSPQCAAWDAAASTTLAGLIADQSDVAEARLGDALFRLRRARRNCRHDFVGLARLDYDALIDGRYGAPREHRFLSGSPDRRTPAPHPSHYGPARFDSRGAMTSPRAAPVFARANRFLRVTAATALSLLATWASGFGAAPSARAGQASASDLAAMKAEYKRPAAVPSGNGPLVELGRALFWDPRVSASGTTACVNCHLPHLGWSSTEPRSRNDSGKFTGRRSQPLLGLRHAKDAPSGWDGRNPTLEAQVKLAIATGAMSMRETATPVRVELIEARIQAIPEYISAFAAAMPEAAVNMDSIATAIAAYERTIEPGIAAFDRWIMGDESAISDSAKRGFLLFNTKAN